MLGFSAVQHAFADTMSETAIHYSHSPLNGPALKTAGPKPGERVVPIAGQTPVGSGTIPRFALFADKTADTLNLVSTFGSILDSDIRPSLHSPGIWLVRPDGSSPADPTTRTTISTA